MAKKAPQQQQAAEAGVRAAIEDDVEVRAGIDDSVEGHVNLQPQNAAQQGADKRPKRRRH